MRWANGTRAADKLREWKLGRLVTGTWYTYGVPRVPVAGEKDCGHNYATISYLLFLGPSFILNGECLDIGI